ncbi:MAG: hypothetical protein COB30_008810 [Ectothiorhodospiraceae bacterium]|nr:hypothetical protein [Ectothiorhodospiraceae bacterium]
MDYLRTWSAAVKKSLWTTTIIATTVASSLFVGSVQASEETYTLFETGQVRPLAMSPNGKRLFAVNTPDNRLEVFKINSSGLEHVGSVPVGLEPVAVAARTNGEVWVVNNVSDSVSIVNVDNLSNMYVANTLLVGDEPRDVVFAGENGHRAFITTAHRGQNTPFDPQLTTPGVGRADVWVFNALQASSSTSLGGDPLTIVNLFTDTPRALTVSPDGHKVYAAGFKTGNQTTTIFETNVIAEGGLPGEKVFVDTNGDGILEPHAVNFEGNVQPSVGLIVRFNGENWVDEEGKIWDQYVKFNLPDKDVFVIDAMANPPAEIANASYQSVGATLFNMVTNPVSGKVYVSNLEALNDVRFTGPGTTGGSTVRGHFVESRLSVLSSTGSPQSVTSLHLNKHIDYSQCCAAVPNDENAKSLAQPGGMAISEDGETLYIAAFGSSKIGIYETEDLEDNSFVPDVNDQVIVSGGGPSGMVLDEENERLYVLTRFDNSISVIDIDDKVEVAHIAMYNPEPVSITEGRQYLYDASLTSSHGDSSCGGCHIFGDNDSLAWDLGNPDGIAVNNPGPLKINHEDFGLPLDPSFQPMKGPMTTQSLRGMANHGAMHWRGDQTGGNEEPTVQPDGGTFDEDLGFKKFNSAFVDLHGLGMQLPAQAMQEYTDFALQITYPPNPVRALDNSLTTAQQAGSDFFFDPTKIVDTVFNCDGCHVVDRTANAGSGVLKPGFFGTDGSNTFAFQPQFLKVPHLRNMYSKVGMFGMANTGFFLADDPFDPLDPFNGNENVHTGDQIRGFGFIHDGSVDTMFRFHNILGFLPRPAGAVSPLDPGNPDSLPISPEGLEIRRNLEEFLMVFDSNLFPIVGQQVSISASNIAIALPRLQLMLDRADLGECEVVARRNNARGFLYVGNGEFKRNRAAAPLARISGLQHFLSRHPNAVITFTAVPPNNGNRIALDRDEDGFLDGDERIAGSDPADASSVPM